MSCIQEQPTEGMRPDASENSQISPSTIVRAARAAGSHPTSRQSCCKAGKARIFTPARESSGESRFNPIGICSCDYPCVALIIEVERDQRFIICEKCLRFLYQYRRRFRQCCEIGKALQNLLAL